MWKESTRPPMTWIKVADGVWIAKGADAPEGARVRVVGQEGAILLVENLD